MLNLECVYNRIIQSTVHTVVNEQDPLFQLGRKHEKGNKAAGKAAGENSTFTHDINSI